MLNKKKAKDYFDYSVLHSFLESKVGQLWDKVYSEICHFADDKTEIGQEIRHRILWMVEKNVYILNGEAYTQHSHFPKIYPIEDLYVDPNTGFLCKGKYKSRSWKQPHTNKLEIDYIQSKFLPINLGFGDVYDFKQIKGCWFVYWITKNETTYPIYHNGVKVDDGIYIQENYHQRQLSKEEIKKNVTPNLQKGTNSKLYARIRTYLPASEWKLNG